MPYGISENQSDCSTWAAVKIEADGSATTLECYITKQDAIDRMVAQSLAEGLEPAGEVGQRKMSKRNESLVAFIDSAITILMQAKASYEEDEMEDELEGESEIEPMIEPEENWAEVSARKAQEYAKRVVEKLDSKE